MLVKKHYHHPHHDHSFLAPWCQPCSRSFRMKKITIVIIKIIIIIIIIIISVIIIIVIVSLPTSGANCAWARRDGGADGQAWAADGAAGAPGHQVLWRGRGQWAEQAPWPPVSQLVMYFIFHYLYRPKNDPMLLGGLAETFLPLGWSHFNINLTSRSEGYLTF